MRGRRLILGLVATIALGLIMLQGCRTESGKRRVALVMKSLANEFFKTMEDGAKAHQKSHAAQYELIANGIPDEQSVGQQNDLVQKMIAQKVTAIVLAPADSKALVPVCKQAVDAGIVVVNIDNKLDSGALAEKNLKIPFVGPDNRAGARLAGEHLAKKVRAAQPAGTIEVAIIEGKKGAFNAEQRRLGFEDAMKAANITVATSQSANWETDQANALVGPILTANGNIKAFLCANDSMALGVAAAIRNNPQWKQKGIFVVGFDNIAAAQELIKNGSMLCSVDQHADQIAVNGIEYALQIIAKQAPPADRQTPVDLVTAESLKK